MRTIQVSALFLTLFFETGILRAQGVAVMDSARIELGYFDRRIKRAMQVETTNRRLDEPRSWARHSLFLRVRLAEGMTGLVTGMYWPTSDHPTGRRYQATTLGGGVAVYPLRRGSLRLGFSFSYFWQRWTDESPQEYHKTVDGFVAAAHLERVIVFKGQTGMVWVGPGFILDRNREEPRYLPQQNYSSVDNLGLITGASVLFLRHLRVYAEFTYANFIQPELGFSIVL